MTQQETSTLANSILKKILPHAIGAILTVIGSVIGATALIVSTVKDNDKTDEIQNLRIDINAVQVKSNTDEIRRLQGYHINTKN